MVDNRFKVEQLNEQPKTKPKSHSKKSMEAYARTANKTKSNVSRDI